MINHPNTSNPNFLVLTTLFSFIILGSVTLFSFLAFEIITNSISTSQNVMQYLGYFMLLLAFNILLVISFIINYRRKRI